MIAAALALGSLVPAAFAATTSSTVSGRKSISVNAKVVSQPFVRVAKDSGINTSYIGEWYLGQAVKAAGGNYTWDSGTKTFNLTLPGVDASNISVLGGVGSGNTTIQINSVTVKKLNSFAAQDPAGGKTDITTFIPLYYIGNVFNAIGSGSSWDGNTFAFKTFATPVQNNETAPLTGTTTVPVATTTAPAGTTTAPAGTTTVPVATTPAPAGTTTAPAGTTTAPAGTTTAPAGTTTVPADTATAPSGSSANTTAATTGQGVTTPATVTTSGVATSPVAAATVPMIIFTWTNSLTSMNDAMSHSAINSFSNDNYSFDANGNLDDGTPSASSTVANLVNYGKTNNVDIYATVANWSLDYGQAAKIASTVLNSTSLRTKLEDNLVNLATTDGYSGIDLDVEQVQPADQTVFTDFVDELAAQLHADGKKLSVTIPGGAGQSYYSGYNPGAIGQAADIVPVMTYDYHWAGGSSGAIAPLPWVNQVMQYLTSQIPPSKVLLGIGAYGYDWYTGDNNVARMLTLPKIDTLIQTDNLSPLWDSIDSVPYLQYTDSSGALHTIYYENQTSLQDKMALVKQYGLGGIAFWQAGQENTAFWNAVN